MTRPIAWRDGREIGWDEFVRDAAAVVRALPVGSAMIDLCEDRYRFLAAYAAALSLGHGALLPPTRAEEVIREIEAAHPSSYRCDDQLVEAAFEEIGRASCRERV